MAITLCNTLPVEETPRIYKGFVDIGSPGLACGDRKQLSFIQADYPYMDEP